MISIAEDIINKDGMSEHKYPYISLIGADYNLMINGNKSVRWRLKGIDVLPRIKREWTSVKNNQ